MAGGGNKPPTDPWDELRGLGVEATNGYRTQADLSRIRSQGYKPAKDSLHLDGDAMDLTPGTSGLSMPDLHARANDMAKRWGNGARAINEGHHVHLQLPGWGKAPGTPGTPNAGIPALPAGFNLVQRGSLKATGQVHDGDTFKLDGGKNARLFGVDAYETGQQGRNSSNALVPLGTQGRNFLSGQISPQSIVSGTGDFTF